ncbi:hypothetical protein [Deinococcus arenicola]|uniref:Uncharacterized protein n=1 Tax=Deinococcus arenicola TaxID=2994950 RepID=A0ABU4DP83_9DEIO|nr:hypothetical protein [Deinococcus sp. ZS9-10]MDV6373904.1 hypothetical protein [Deinococcus sp. ZS9-10]
MRELLNAALLERGGVEDGLIWQTAWSVLCQALEAVDPIWTRPSLWVCRWERRR